MIALLVWTLIGVTTVSAIAIYNLNDKNHTLEAENNALRDQLEAHADTLIGYDKTLHDYNDSCNFEAK